MTGKPSADSRDADYGATMRKLAHDAFRTAQALEDSGRDDEAAMMRMTAEAYMLSALRASSARVLSAATAWIKTLSPKGNDGND